MPTSIHLPDDIRSMVDQRAKALGVSRNRFIVDALRNVFADNEGWSPGFICALDAVEPSLVADVNAMEREVVKRRKSKAAVEFEQSATKRATKVRSR